MPDINGVKHLATYITVKHGFAFEGRYFCDEPTTEILVTPGNFAIGGGFQKGKSKYYAGPIPQDYILRGGDLVVTMTDLSKAGDTLGYPALIPTENNRVYLHNQRIGLVSIIEPDQLDRGYLYYLLCTDAYRNHILATASGSTVRHTSPTRICDFSAKLPPLKEQQATAKTLRVLDDKIEQNRRTSRALEELAQATFKAWFTDFEPIKAKATGHTGFPGMPSSAFAALPNHLADSPVGPVPEGWAVRPIGDLVTVKGGGTPSTKIPAYWDDGTHFWATPKDLSGLKDPVLLGTERRITDAGAESISSGVMPKNTVLLSSRAPVGYTALAKVPVAVNQGFIAMTCDGPLPPHYILHWTRSALEEIKSRASGTTFPEISKSAFRPIPVVVPDSVVVEAFECVAQELFDLIESNARETDRLAELRDYLLPHLLRGAVRVEL